MVIFSLKITNGLSYTYFRINYWINVTPMLFDFPPVFLTTLLDMKQMANSDIILLKYPAICVILLYDPLSSSLPSLHKRLYFMICYNIKKYQEDILVYDMRRQMMQTHVVDEQMNCNQYLYRGMFWMLLYKSSSYLYVYL